MLEVEETSDLAVTLLQGIHARRGALLDRVYEQYDDQFPRSSEVSVRFRLVMDRIHGSIGGDLPNLVFHRRALFNTLFTFYYDRLYGLGSEIKRVQPKALPPRIVDVLRQASDRIESEQIPANLAKVLRGGG